MTDQPAPIQQNPALINYTWMAIAVAAPIAMLMPPRRMDSRFLILSGAFSLSTDQLLKEYTGKGVYGRFQSRVESLTPSGLPERAKETQRRLREERAAVEAGLSDEERKALEERRKPGGLRGWFGADEGDGWKAKRLEEHQRKMEEGKGISDLIKDHVSEAFGGKGEGEDEGDDKPDEKKK
ncbi:hypothetical protein IMZ48_38295 [Candidatus Bathyarchaeota archaeon]|nr:hypothetical protein [Candidatus Bathyarchaeota archaeon]